MSRSINYNEQEVYANIENDCVLQTFANSFSFLRAGNQISKTH
jgi:hypothetical protein